MENQADNPNGAEGATAVKERVAPPKVDRLPPYRVLLHNDDVHDMGYVVRTIEQLTPLGFASAFTVMLEAHRKGIALVLATHRELAELYQEQFQSKRLTVTIEPAE